jgi:hypothetical protein
MKIDKQKIRDSIDSTEYINPKKASDDKRKKIKIYHIQDILLEAFIAMYISNRKCINSIIEKTCKGFSEECCHCKIRVEINDSIKNYEELDGQL